MRNWGLVIAGALMTLVTASCKPAPAGFTSVKVHVSDPALICSSPETAQVLKSLFFDVGSAYSEANEPAYAAVANAAVIEVERPTLDSYDGATRKAQCSGVAVYRNGVDATGAPPRLAITFTVKPSGYSTDPVYDLIQPSSDEVSLAFFKVALAASQGKPAPPPGPAVAAPPAASSSPPGA